MDNISDSDNNYGQRNIYSSVLSSIPENQYVKDGKRQVSPEQPLLSGDQILDIIPQRPPMCMIDTLFHADEKSAEAGLEVSENNVFCIGGFFVEPGIIEHSAQSAAAFAGYRNYLAGEAPHIGLIGEIKYFRIGRLPSVGEKLRTKVTLLADVMGMSLVQTSTEIEGKQIAEGQIKIFIQG